MALVYIRRREIPWANKHSIKRLEVGQEFKKAERSNNKQQLMK